MVRCGNVAVTVSRSIIFPSGTCSVIKAVTFTAHLAWNTVRLREGSKVLDKEVGRTNGVFDIYIARK
jgi:hypothetical protein